MKIAVVYESMFGNTKLIAQEIADALREAGDVRSGSVDELSPDAVRGVDLFVVGGPTQNRAMAKAETRRSLLSRDGAVLPGTTDLRTWLAHASGAGVRAASFDTRYNMPFVGSAAKQIATSLREKGFSVVAVESFFVQGKRGPLVDGERERARAWALGVARSVGTPVPA